MFLKGEGKKVLVALELRIGVELGNVGQEGEVAVLPCRAKMNGVSEGGKISGRGKRVLGVWKEGL